MQAPHEDVVVFDPKLKEMYKEDKFYTWGYYDVNTGEHKGYRESAAYIVNYINTNGPFDGILGFSQGGLIARFIAKSKEKILEHYRPNTLPSFLILFSSGLMRVPIAELFTNYNMPILHIYGTNDKITPDYNSSINVEGVKSVIKHDKGHSIPRLANGEMETFIEFIKQQYMAKFGVEMKFDKIIDENYTEILSIKVFSKLNFILN